MNKAKRFMKHINDFEKFDEKHKDNGFNNQTDFWHIKTLKKAVKDQKLKVFMFDISQYNHDHNMWSNNHYSNWFHHVERILNCDTNQPIIINNYGCVVDGYHRMIKRILIDKKVKIKAVKLKTMPEPDEKYIDGKWVKQ